MSLPVASQIYEAGSNIITLPAVRGSRTKWESGDIVSIMGIAHILSGLSTAIAGDSVNGVTAGTFDIDCATGTTASIGQEAFYNESTRLVVTSPGTGVIPIGKFAAAKTSGQLKARVLLNGINAITGSVQNRRIRVTTAEVNAGLVLLPALAGVRYRLVDVTLIAVGGAAATATAVILTATQSASVVSLISAAVAALTQSTVVKPNTGSVTVLANGASFAQNDANTAISIAKTGSDLATATHIDVILSYTIEA